MDKTPLITQGKNDSRTFNNSRKVAAGQGDNYTTGCLLDYPFS